MMKNMQSLVFSRQKEMVSKIVSPNNSETSYAHKISYCEIRRELSCSRATFAFHELRREQLRQTLIRCPSGCIAF